MTYSAASFPNSIIFHAVTIIAVCRHKEWWILRFLHFLFLVDLRISYDFLNYKKEVLITPFGFILFFPWLLALSQNELDHVRIILL